MLGDFLRERMKRNIPRPIPAIPAMGPTTAPAIQALLDAVAGGGVLVDELVWEAEELDEDEDEDEDEEDETAGCLRLVGGHGGVENQKTYRMWERPCS